MRILPLLIILLFPLTGISAYAQDGDRAAVMDSIEDAHGGAEAFVTAFDVLQQAVAQRDAATVSAFINYPLVVSIDGRSVRLRGEDDLIERFDTVFDPDLSAVVVEQDFADLEVRDSGVYFTDDAVRMISYCTDRSCAVRYWLVRGIEPLE
jgi:hypothetical protein